MKKRTPRGALFFLPYSLDPPAQSAGTRAAEHGSPPHPLLHLHLYRMYGNHDRIPESLTGSQSPHLPATLHHMPQGVPLARPIAARTLAVLTDTEVTSCPDVLQEPLSLGKILRSAGYGQPFGGKVQLAHQQSTKQSRRTGQAETMEQACYFAKFVIRVMGLKQAGPVAHLSHPE